MLLYREAHNMKDQDSSAVDLSSTMIPKRESLETGLVGKTHYKFWVLAAIILLALWSMFTGSVTLKRSAGNLACLSDEFDSRILDDLDVLEVEDREKVVRRMWDVYTHSTSIRLPRFWLEAFQAAYKHLVSDVPGVRDVAVSEIAKMSLRSFNLDHLPLQSESHTQSTTRVSRKIKEGENDVVSTVVNNS